MRTTVSILAMMGILGYATSAMAQLGSHAPEGNFGPTAHETPPSDKDDIFVGPDPEGNAENLRLQGKCDRAVPTLRRFARRGAGYEVAQYNLAMCLYDLAAVDKVHGAELRSEGAEWMVRAANGGSALAQAEAVRIYLTGDGAAADPVEADKWSLLYRRNPTRTAFGLHDLPPETAAKLDALSDPQLSEAEKRARGWVQTPLPPQ